MKLPTNRLHFPQPRVDPFLVIYCSFCFNSWKDLLPLIIICSLSSLFHPNDRLLRLDYALDGSFIPSAIMTINSMTGLHHMDACIIMALVEHNHNPDGSSIEWIPANDGCRKQLYELSDDPRRKEFLDDLFSFMQKKGKDATKKGRESLLTCIGPIIVGLDVRGDEEALARRLGWWWSSSKV